MTFHWELRTWVYYTVAGVVVPTRQRTRQNGKMENHCYCSWRVFGKL
jgi:hypothetical protein